MFSLTSAEQAAGDSVLDRCLTEAAHGSKEALSRLYTAIGKEIFGFALSIVRNYYDAQDIQQEVFVKVWQCAGQYRPGSKPKAWIFTITRNLALSSLRKSSRVSSSEVPELPFHDAPAEDRLALMALLEALADEERQIVMLHTMGMKHREISNLVGLPLSTVLSKYSRAIKKLKKCLESENNA